MDTKYTLNLSTDEEARDANYNLTVTMRNIGSNLKGVGILRVDKNGTAEETLTDISTRDFYTTYKTTEENGAYTAIFNKNWGFRGTVMDDTLVPGDTLYLYWSDGSTWHLYSKINLEVKQATNSAWWKDLSLNLSGSGKGTLTLPKGMGKLNTNVLHFNMYAMLDLSGKLMIGYGNDWFKPKDKDAFFSSAYKPSGSRWGQAAERMKRDISKVVWDKFDEGYDFANSGERTKVLKDWKAGFDVYGCVIAQWNAATGYYSGDVVVSAGFFANGSVTFYVVIPVANIPVYFGVEGTGSGRLTIDAGAQFKGGDFATFLRTVQISDGSGVTLNVNLSAAVYAGMGWRGAVSAEANMALSLDMIFGFGTANTQGWHYPFHTKGVLDWSLTLRAQLFFITYTYKVNWAGWTSGKKTLWDSWSGDPYWYAPEAQTLSAQNMPGILADAEKYDVYTTDLAAVSEGVYDDTTDTYSETGHAAMLAAKTEDKETMLESNVLSGASLQLVTAKGGKNADHSYLFRIASVTDKTTGKATPRLTVQDGGQCESTLGQSYVLPADPTGEDAGKLPYDYNFAVCDDKDGGSGKFTIAVTTGYLDESHSLKERTRDLRVRVYSFNSETGEFTQLQTLMPPEDANSGYCGTPVVYGDNGGMNLYGISSDWYFVAAPVLTNLDNEEMLTNQIADAFVRVSTRKGLGQTKNEVKLQKTRSFVRMLGKPIGSTTMFLYTLDSNRQKINCYVVDAFNKCEESPITFTPDDAGTITNFSYMNGCAGYGNWIYFTSGGKLYVPYAFDKYPFISFQLKDVTGHEMSVPSAENSLLVFTDNQQVTDPASLDMPVGDSFHAIAITKTGNGEDEVQSNIYSYDFTVSERPNAPQSGTTDYTESSAFTCNNSIRNQVQVLKDRNINSFTGGYHANVKSSTSKDLRLIYLADDTATVIEQPDANGVGKIKSSSKMFNFEQKALKDAVITSFTIGSKTVNTKQKTFDISFIIKNTGIESLNDVTLKLKDQKGNTLQMGLDASSMSDELTVSPPKVFWFESGLLPGMSMTRTAKVRIDKDWLAGDRKLTLSITKIDGTPLQELEIDTDSGVAVYANDANESDDDHSATDEIDLPSLNMDVHELVYKATGENTPEKHYAQITFNWDNILSMSDAEVQIYGYDENNELVQLDTYSLGRLSASGDLTSADAATYTLLIPLKEEWKHKDETGLWFLYYVICDEGADPFLLKKDQSVNMNYFDVAFLSNLEERMTATVKTSSADPFKGIVTSKTDRSYLPTDNIDIEISAEAYDGYIFDGWYDEYTGELFSKNANAVIKDLKPDTLYALQARFAPDPANTAYCVTVAAAEDAAGNVLGQAMADIGDTGAEARMLADGGLAYAVYSGNTIQLTAEPYDPDEYRFKEWRLGDTVLSTDADFTYTPTGDSNIVAVFEQYPATSVKVYLDPIEGYGSDLGWKRTKDDGKLATLPTPKRDGYTFQGWYTAQEGGERITTDTVFTNAKTMVYAHYAVSTDPTPNTPVQPTTPDNGGGTDNGNSANSSASTANTENAQKTAAQAAGLIPRTADEFPLAVVILLLVIGAGGFAVVVLLRKRNKK